MNYWQKDRKNKTSPPKRRPNWSQSLPSPKGTKNKIKKIKKSLQYLLIIRKFNNIIDYKNIKLLKVFLTKYGKIRPRRKTRISIKKQHRISKAIRKARAYKLLPFTCDVKA